MTRTSTCIYHSLVLSWYIFINYYIFQLGRDPQKRKIFPNAQRWKYLTFLNLTIFYGVACLEDVLKRIKGKKDIKFITAFRDLLFTTLAFPVSTVVFLLFWIFFLYDREVVYPKYLDDIFPVWLNHAMHTCVLPFSLIEVIFRPYCYPLKKKGLSILTVAFLAYISRILWIYSQTGTWVYPVFAKFSPVGIAVFFSLSYIFTTGIYLLEEKLNHWKWAFLPSRPFSALLYHQTKSKSPRDLSTTNLVTVSVLSNVAFWVSLTSRERKDLLQNILPVHR